MESNQSETPVFIMIAGDEINVRYRQDCAQGPPGGAPGVDVPVHVPPGGDGLVLVPNSHSIRQQILAGTLKTHRIRMPTNCAA